MDSYRAAETPVDARRDPLRRLLLPFAVGAWIVGGLLLLGAAAGIVASLVGLASEAPIRTVLHTVTTLPANAATARALTGPHVVDGTRPVMTAVEASIGGLPPTVGLTIRLAPTVALAAAGVVTVLLGLVVRRVEVRVAASRPTVVAAAVLVIGSAVSQALGYAAAVAIGAVAWTGLDGVDGLSDVGAAGFDPVPFAIAAGLLVVAYLLRRLEGAGVLVPLRGARTGATAR